MAQFAADAFSGADGTLLETYNSAWVKFGGGTTNLTTQSGRAKPASSSTLQYFHSAVPASADYSVSCDLYRPDTFSVLAGPVIRATGTSTATFYHARYSTGAGAYQLYRYTAGAAQILGTSAAYAFNATESHTLKLEANGSQINVYLDGNATPIITAVDANITTAGYGGLRSASVSGYFDNYSADTLGGSAISGAGAATLGSVAGSASGGAVVAGAGVAALDTLGATGAGTVADLSTITGAASVALGVVAGGGSGSVLVAGAGGAALGQVQCAAAGGAVVAGVASAALGAVGGSASGETSYSEIVGSASAALGPVGGASDGAVAVLGAGAVVLGSVRSGGPASFSPLWRYDVPSTSLRFDIPGASLRYDIPGAALAATI